MPLEKNVNITYEDHKYLISGKTYPLKEFFLSKNAKWDSDHRRWIISDEKVTKDEIIKYIKDIDLRKRTQRSKSMKAAHEYKKKKINPVEIEKRKSNWELYLNTPGCSPMFLIGGPEAGCDRCHWFVFDTPQTTTVSSCKFCNRSWDD